MTEEIVQTRGLSKSYPGGTVALKDVDLTIQKGDRFVLLGPNGAGKSTLVRILSSLSRGDSGECHVCGLDPRRDARKLMEEIGVVTQDNDLDPHATGEELLRFQGRLFGLDRITSAARAQELITAMDLADHAHKRVHALSGGNKRKLHCALALVHRPRLLFLDEPTVGMDPEVRARFWASLRHINRDEGTTLVLTTQYLDEAERHADQLALLRDGRIAYRGTVASFIEEGTTRRHGGGLEEGYLTYLREVNNAAY
jgi:ABC-2 type transport system ATP-binding protein